MIRNLFIGFCSVIFSMAMSAESIRCQIKPTSTHKFIEREKETLYLDYYDAAKGSCTKIGDKEKPAILFVFGGGFTRGTRDKQVYLPWFKQLTDNGYKVFSIDYRLGLKGKKITGIASVNALEYAIKIGVEDLFAATSYLVKNAKQFGISPDNIVASGSSAGAIIALQAEYEIANNTDITSILPEGYNYKGLISFSGAIFSRKGKLKFKNKTCPILMMHGTEDKVVPYNQIRFFNLGFFGTNKITDRLNKFGCEYNTIRYKGNKHEIAESMEYTLSEQLRFLETNIVGGHRRIVDMTTSDPTIPEQEGASNFKEIYD